MVCMSGNKGTIDMLNKEQSSAFVALAMNWGCSFLKFIINEMKGNLKESKSERFMMLLRGVVTRDLKLLNESTFPLMLQNRGGKYKFQGLLRLKKFGEFAEMEGVDAVETSEIPNVFVEEEHDVEIVSSKPFDEDVYVVKLPEYEDDLTREEPDMDFDFEMETLPIFE
ncbi:hypothetical protein R6Q59_029365 [Mikania micrantha]